MREPEKVKEVNKMKVTIERCNLDGSIITGCQVDSEEEASVSLAELANDFFNYYEDADYCSITVGTDYPTIFPRT